MDVKITKEAARTFVAVSGRLDTSSADSFREKVSSLLEEDKPDIEVDCTDLEYTSSQGLRMFLIMQKGVSAKGGKLVLVNMQPQVKEVFDITGFTNIIKIL